MYSKSSPYLSFIKERFALSGPSSSKNTYHISLDTSENTLPFTVGDSVAIFPENDPEIVEQILYHLKTDGQEPIFDKRANETLSFKEFLLKKANLQKCSFHKLLDTPKTALPLLELVKHHPLMPEQIASVLLPLLPRFYSIASSPKLFPSEMHLTVAHVEYELCGQKQHGVGSHFLCHKAKVGSTLIPIYIQPSNHFTLPENPEAPIIMIGPGTGIAPFRAFLQQRLADQASGHNWLFFGERNRASDFYYGDFFSKLEEEGRLRLSTAFSRDQSEKVYVQHKILEEKKSIWDWIQNGAYIYVCGDAKQMAKGVDLALQTLIQEEGGMSEEDARLKLKEMRRERRYLLDVY